MKTFTSKFFVRAPLQAVLGFHSSTQALKQLTPPPMRVELLHIEPLANGSLAKFILGLGPIRLPWLARHENVSLQGFTDVQKEGPLAFWKHQHQFETQSGRVLICDTINYQLPTGMRGFWLWFMFNPLMLRLLFFYRALATRSAVKKFTNGS